GEQLRIEARGVYNGDTYLGNKIQLYGNRLDEMFELLLQKSGNIPFYDKIEDVKYDNLFVEERTPQVELTLKNDYENSVFRGIEVSGTLPECITGEQNLYYLEKAHLYRIDKEKESVLLPLIDASVNGKIKFHVGRKSLADFCYYTLPMLEESISILDKTEDVLGQYLPPKAAFRFYLDEEQGKLFCDAKVMYGEDEYALMENAVNTLKQNGRDSYAEKEVVEPVLKYCPQISEEPTGFICEGDDAICRMLENGIRELMAYGEVLCTDRLKRIHLRRQTKMSVGVSLESGLMELEISTDDISPKELLDLLASYRKKKKYHRLSNGDFVNTQDENVTMLASMIDSMQISAKEILKGKMQVPAYRALYLDKVLEKNETLYVERDRHFKNLIKEFKTTDESDFEVPASLQKIMRPYQITGFKWLKTLENYGFGGILADDMGLGKTLQVISVLLQAKEEGKEGVSLIVTPASLIYNWQEEFKKFAPQMKTKVISGTQAERQNVILECKEYDVLITSYDLLKRDIAQYEDKKFLYQVIDEAQYIKNHSTATAKA
ncbi:MAG: SNF2 helicase associated domain-containing protein, partial [Lachnospiraceae bacterium]|nr:SNF2 helicase associated domain-containing protein [Lachnospiraceae bacterium]